MADERCPWCGAESRYKTKCNGRIYACDSVVWGDGSREQLPDCETREVAQLRARIARLESALRTIADTHGPGTIAGDAAREGVGRDD